MKPDRNPQKRTFVVGTEQYQKNFGLYLIVFVLAGALMILSNTFGWDSALIFGITIVVSAALILIFNPKSTKVRIELEAHHMRVYDISEKDLSPDPSYDFDLDMVSTFTCKRSGRYAELLRIVVSEREITSTFVFSTQPSPKNDDPLRKLEEALKGYVR